jgi:hypothetical protein
VTTSHISSSSGEVVAAPIYGIEEDAPTTGSVVAVAPPAAVISAVEAVSGAGALLAYAAPAAQLWGLLSPEVP